MLNHLKSAQNTAYTENNAVMYQTTKSSLLDLFGTISAMRNTDTDKIITAFDQAFCEDKLLAMKILFHCRNVRGGQGERKTFRTILRYLATTHPDVVKKNLAIIPEFGRYDDLFELLDSPLSDEILSMTKDQLSADRSSMTPSLLAKWTPSINASSKTTIKRGRMICKYLGYTEFQYRKMLVSLREKLNVLERKMTKKLWTEIEYDKIPSKAGMKYKKAFFRNDEARYKAFIQSLVKGEKKINVKALFPYEIVEKVLYSNASNTDDLYNAMWANLPDYIGDSKENAICLVDTSGSMNGTPLAIAVSLGLYCAERLKGEYHNHFITFSARPKLEEIKGSTFCQQVRNLSRAQWDMNTNLEAAFMLILNTATKNNIPQEQLPTRLIMISDMQFDACGFSVDKKFFTVMRERFEAKGYTMPNLLFWQVDTRNNKTMPMTTDDRGFQMVSGASPSIFKTILSNKTVSAYDLMLATLADPMYDKVTI